MRSLEEFKADVRKKYSPAEGGISGWFSTGSYDVDRCMSRGLTRGRFHLWAGKESTCKTTLALHTMRQCNLINWDTGKFDLTLKKPSPTLFVDAEATFDEHWAEKVGIPRASLDKYNYVVKPEHGEMAADLILNAIESNCFGLIVLDSNEALVSSKTIEKSAEDVVMCDRAKILARIYRVGTANMTKAMKTGKSWQVPTVLCLNQVRDNIASLHGGFVYPGGRAQLQYSSTILQFNAPNVVDDTAKSYGMGEFKGVCKKNKIGPPKKSFNFNMALKDLTDEDGKGLSAAQIDNASSMLSDIGKLGLMHKNEAGKWVILGDEYRVQADFKTKVRDDYEFQRKVWNQLLEIDRS